MIVLLSNIVPQDPNNNRGIWEAIESAVRYQAKKYHQLYVVTGPIFQGDQIQSLKGRVAIPTALFKCLYDVSKQQAGCYTALNAPGTNYDVVPVAAVEQLTGFNLFPAMPPQTKGMAMRLAEPRLRGVQ